ncbi:MAG: hypothetical protein AUH42_05545 [Gemmatimonadetes bacterium 13_1_40CM_70_11]|nr:MAG: hypothetical protein AUH42_05545 [Gemmatimonadetes bacterium 13_1_40CM_70_11]OLC76946.1 MAG: hypothetical protein AUH78_05385 [Gemmatimonadetes bacterium 13_1_40CM_4_69_8]
MDWDRYAQYIAERASGYWKRFESFGVDLRGKRVLDLGAGPGAFSQRLVEGGSRLTIWYDKSRHYALRFRSAAARGRPACGQVIGDMGVLPFAQGAFDLVYCRASLHYARSQGATLDEIRRVLGRGGHLYVEFDNFRRVHRDYPRLSWKRLGHHVFGFVSSLLGLHLRPPAFQVAWLVRLRMIGSGLVPVATTVDGDLVAVLARKAG